MSDLQAFYTELAKTGLTRRLFELARDEDLGISGAAAGVDITSASISDPQAPITAQLNARVPLTVAGLAAIPELIAVFGGSITHAAAPNITDGITVPARTTLATMQGPRAAVLTLERTLLNVVSRLSGVATLTRAFVDRIKAEAPTARARIYDTRKTTPGLRVLEKYAVRCGGGQSHRLGLYDAVLIKDNHVAGLSPREFAQAVAQAAARARQTAASASRTLQFIEAEVDSLDQLDALLALPPKTIDIVLLDNMSLDQLRDAVRRRNTAATEWARSMQLEASGGVRLDTVGAIAATGVERISAGALTHQAVSVDIGLDVRG